MAVAGQRQVCRGKKKCVRTKDPGLKGEDDLEMNFEDDDADCCGGLQPKYRREGL